jgi:tyrosyl-tRNA synthetase
LGSALAEAGLTKVSSLEGVAVLFKEAGLASSLGDARRAVAEGGAYVNNERVSDADAPLSRDSLIHGKYLVLRRGKKTIAGVELV